MLYNPGLGQGHGKKRHLHAHSPVNFKELKCYEFSKAILRLILVINPVNFSYQRPPKGDKNRPEK
jgi:hypothetical protein